MAVQHALRDRSQNTELTNKRYGVFHVREARGSQHIPAQDEFVTPYGMKSVGAIGGVISSGDLFVTIMFSKTSISDNVARNLEGWDRR